MQVARGAADRTDRAKHDGCGGALAIDGRGLGTTIDHRLRRPLVRSTFDSYHASAIESDSG